MQKTSLRARVSRITIRSTQMSELTSRRAPTPPNNGGLTTSKSKSNDAISNEQRHTTSRRISRLIVDKLWCILPPLFVALSGLALYGRMELVSLRTRWSDGHILTNTSLQYYFGKIIVAANFHNDGAIWGMNGCTISFPLPVLIDSLRYSSSLFLFLSFPFHVCFHLSHVPVIKTHVWLR